MGWPANHDGDRGSPAAPSRRGLFALVLALLWAGCGEDPRPLIERAVPLNGSTNVATTVLPELHVAEGASLDLEDGGLVLYDVTQGARLTVPAQIMVEGTRIVYQPEAPLARNHDFALVLLQGAISGDMIDEIDSTEQPEESIAWPWVLSLSTASRPQVRAAYLERRDKRAEVSVRFSQPMDPVTTGPTIQVLNTVGEPLAVDPPLWVDETTVTLTVGVPLDPALPYTLRVGSGARSLSGTLLDGDGDGAPGEPDDAFTASFTGSQRVIVSRLGNDPSELF